MPDANAVDSQRLQLAELIARFAAADGTHETDIASLVLYRASAPSPIIHTLYRPALCIMAQARRWCAWRARATATTRCTTWWPR